MNDEHIRKSLKACLSDSRFLMEKQQEVLERIKGEKMIIKRKLTYSFFCGCTAAGDVVGLQLSSER